MRRIILSIGITCIVLFTATVKGSDPCMPVSSAIVINYYNMSSIDLGIPNCGDTVAEFEKSQKAVIDHLSQNGFKDAKRIGHDYKKGAQSYNLFFKAYIDMSGNDIFVRKNKNFKNVLVTGSAFVNFKPDPVMGVVTPEYIILRRVYCGELPTKRLKNLAYPIERKPLKIENVDSNLMIASRLANGKPIIEKYFVIHGTEKYPYTATVVTKDTTYEWLSGYFSWDVVPEWELGDDNMMDGFRIDCPSDEFADKFLADWGFRLSYTSVGILNTSFLGLIR